MATPTEKFEKVFLELASISQADGALIGLGGLNFEAICTSCGLRDTREFMFYFEAILQRGLIKQDLGRSWYQVSIEGLNYHISLLNEGENSSNCFVAMQFRPEHEPARLAIVEASMRRAFIQSSLTKATLWRANEQSMMKSSPPSKSQNSA